MMKPVKIEFTEKNLTGNAGLVHFGRFIQKLNLKEILMKQISIPRAPNAVYQVSDAIIILILGVIAGVRHMSHLAILRTDNVIRSIFNWENFPDDSTLGRIFKLFSHASCQELSEVENLVRWKVWRKKWFGRVTLDFDSSVRGVFGSQEGAETGYNPGKKGQKSYHPGSPAQVVMSNSFIKLVFLSEPFFLKTGLPQPDKYGIKPEYFFINFFIMEVRYVLSGLRF